jgi:hypothetical protein
MFFRSKREKLVLLMCFRSKKEKLGRRGFPLKKKRKMQHNTTRLR